jgi:hypothetical protein
MIHRHSHREERSAADRAQPTLARRIQRLAASGDHEGFNAIIGALLRENEFDATAIDVIKRDGEFRQRITDLCQETWQRKHARH